MTPRNLSAPVLVVVLLGGLSGCQKPDATAAMRQQAVAIGTTKADLFGVPAEYRALHVGLEKCLGRPVWFNTQHDGASIYAQMEMGNVPFAILSAAEYASIPDPSKLNLLASGVNAAGRTTRKAFIVVRATDDRFRTISDCAGKRFAFGTYGDVLTDLAARDALARSGVPLNKLLPELLPPPFAMEGRLYVQNDAAMKIALDLTVNAGVIDEIVYTKMPDSGGNPITGPSKDQFRILGETAAIPEILVVAGPGADPEMARKLQDYLISEVKQDPKACQELGLIGFAPPDRAACESVRRLIGPTK